MEHSLQTIDVAIIVAYLLVIVGKSVALRKIAAQGSENYFLAGKEMPWWALGASGMSSNIDVAGTITIVSLVFVYGLHGFFIEMRGGVVLPIAVFFAFMGKWHQRSKVVTTGEWMLLRFGHDWQGKLARFTAVATYVILTISMVSFFLVATGKFLPKFLPFNELTCQIVMAGIMLVYTMLSGLYGVVWTDVIQTAVLGVVAIYLTILASGFVNDELLSSWSAAPFNSILPTIAEGLPSSSSASNALGSSTSLYSPFLLFLFFWMGKGVLEGLGGSGGSAYMAQRFYAAKDEPTVKKLCMLWTVLFAFRWPMILAFVVLGLHLEVSPDNADDILPTVLNSGVIGPGMLGVVLVAILAASMSTFDSTINAGASYIVRDVYLVQKKNATEKQQVRAGYFASAGLVVLGMVIAGLIEISSSNQGNTVLSIWRAIVVQLFPAFLVPFALRWFWDRFNGVGFCVGIVVGFGASLLFTFMPVPQELLHFSPFIAQGQFTDVSFLGGVSFLSFLGSVIATYASKPTAERHLKRFYQQVRPFGRWPTEWKASSKKEHRSDFFRLFATLIWQITTFLWPMTAFLRMGPSTAILVITWIAVGVYLLKDIQRDTA